MRSDPIASHDVAIIGAGASGLMCALTAASRGKSVLVVDHNSRVGQKLLITGGGRCNFSNKNVDESHFQSSNPQFVKSALARFASRDITSLLDSHDVDWQEEDQGKLFCARSAHDIVDMFEGECRRLGVLFKLETKIVSVERSKRFAIKCKSQNISANSVVVATGGLSYPKLGASDFGYRIAERFNIPLIKRAPALVPMIFGPSQRALFSQLAGVSVNAGVSSGKKSFVGDILFTHRGLSGPAILELSLHWNLGDLVEIDLFPDKDIDAVLLKIHDDGGKELLHNALAKFIPRRLAIKWCELNAESRPINSYSKKELRKIAEGLGRWVLSPSGTEGYSTAEVTRGGVDTRAINSKTMEARDVNRLYFIGEALDVTGQIGGYNLHWAWASGHAAGEAV